MSDEAIPHEETCLYLIGNRKRKLLKVGISRRPKTRLARLQTANPYDLTLFAAIPFPSFDDALEFEAQMHFWLRHLSLRGEWFKLTGTAANFVACAEERPTVHSLLRALDVSVALDRGEAARNAVAIRANVSY